MSESPVMVAGAGSEIGLACARGLLRDGPTVAATGIGEIPDELAVDGNCLPLSFDISSEDACFHAVKATVDRFSGIRAVIHFAGIHRTKTWEEVTPEDFARVYAVNVTESFLTARAAAREMREAGGVELGGVALPKDIANVARFLTSEDARFMTNQIVPVNCGSAFE